MGLWVVDQSASPDEAKERDHDDGDPDHDQGEPVIMTERSREAIELQSRPDLRPAGLGDRSDEEVEFSTTKPNAMIAMPVLTQARKVRSFAAWSEYLSIIETSLDVVDGFRCALPILRLPLKRIPPQAAIHRDHRPRDVPRHR